MKEIRTIHPLLTALIGCCAMPALAFASQPNIKRIGFHAQVTVDADSHASIGEIGGVNGALANAVQSQLAAMRFASAHVNGVPVSATSIIAGTMLLTPLDKDQFSIGLEDLSFAPRFSAAKPIPYPLEMARRYKTGYVELKLRIAADGSATVLQTLSASSADFEKAARDAVKNMQYEPQKIADQPAAIEVNLPFWFHGSWSETKPTFQCAWNEKRPRVEGASGCLELIQVVFSMVRRQL